MTPNRIAAIAGAVLFAAVGGWGLVASMAASDPALEVVLAGVLSTSVPLAALQLAVAAVLAVGAVIGERLARPLNVTIGTLLLALGILGLFVISTPANVLALNGADNVLHFAASSALLATGLGAARREPPA
jgi:hypothetical protein